MIGIGPTVGLVLLTGIAGAWLARTQGFDLVVRIQRELAEGRMPTDELFDGALILIGGVVLLTPGFWTDVSGFICLVPTTRQWLKRIIRNWAEKQLRNGTIQIHRR